MVEKLPNLGLTHKQPWWEKNGAVLRPFQKDFYSATLKASEAGEDGEKKVTEDSEKFSVINKAGNVPKPVTTFEHSGLPRYLVDQLKLQEGFEKPTPIQSQSWPIVLSGRDMVGIAATGSGKTLAFIMPAIVHVNAQELLESGDGPIVLVLTPTRELAMQIQEETQKFAQACKISSAAVYGGVPRAGQQTQMEAGVEILIACPGRLIDFMDCNVINLKRVTYLVLDEADRMLDLGFERQITTIEKHIRPDRQTLMFSATWPKEVRQLAMAFCGNNEPVHIQIGDKKLSANKMIRQEVLVVSEEEKYTKFYQLVQQSQVALQATGQATRIIVFCETKRGVDELVKCLNQDGVRGVKGIHGDKDQKERLALLQQFKEGRVCNILVATDVASRGLDVKDIQMVVNYDMPFQIEDYVHRVGRTARAGSAGVAYSFFTKRNFMVAPDLIEVVQQQSADHKFVIPEPLKQLALAALKAQSANENLVRRRWRKLTGERIESDKQDDSKSRPVVSLAELIKKRKEAQASADTVAQDSSQNLAADQSKPQTKEEATTAEAQPQNPSIEETKEQVVFDVKPEQPIVSFTNYFEKPLDNTDLATKQATPEQNVQNPVYKRKWGKK